LAKQTHYQFSIKTLLSKTRLAKKGKLSEIREEIEIHNIGFH